MTRFTQADLQRQEGRTVLITGGNSGIGFEAAAMLARAGATVVIACRSLDRAAAAADAIGHGVQTVQLDLADLAQVAEAAAEVLQRFPVLDVLVNNAGVMAIPYRETADGVEMQMGTNHLGHFALTGRLLPALLAAPSARVVTVSSFLHKRGTPAWGDADRDAFHPAVYDKWESYHWSKLANAQFTLELGRRARGTSLLSVGAHPGYAATNLQTAGPTMAGSRVQTLLSRIANTVLAQPARRGALPTVMAATAPDLTQGTYTGPSGPGELRGPATVVRYSRTAQDPASAARLWQRSVELTGVDHAALQAPG